MTDQIFERFQLETKFVHLENNGNINGLLVNEKFWSKGSTHLQSGRLMGVMNLDAGPSHWEVHPDGDELLYLLSGSMDVVLESDGKNSAITLTGSSSCIVPKNTWHQTIANGPCTLLFITPSKDTHHRE
jgi:mannose-6-phosphate isomerase-like protein (cupin superfamily)